MTNQRFTVLAHKLRPRLRAVLNRVEYQGAHVLVRFRVSEDGGTDDVRAVLIPYDQYVESGLGDNYEDTPPPKELR